MKMDTTHTQFSRILRLSLIALVVYFSQVYPYVHFHHAHADSDSRLHVDIYPVDAEPYHSHRGHTHDGSSHDDNDSHHHHQGYDQHVDWHLVRSHSNSILSQIDFAYISVQTDFEPTLTPLQGRNLVDSTPIPESVPPDGIDARGPPVRG